MKNLVAIMMGFIDCRVGRTTDPGFTPELIARAERTLIIWIQMEGLPDEYESLLRRGRVSRKSSLSDMNPQLDEHGVMRIFGRLSFADELQLDRRVPMVLPKSHLGTTMIIKDTHAAILKHVSGVHQTFSQLRRKFWIQGGRATVKSAIKNCYRCRWLRSRPMRPREGPIPNFRLPKFGSRTGLFRVTAIDCAGPLYVSQGPKKSPLKRYLLILTCVVYRAINIQVLEDLSTDAFMMAMTRFFNAHARPEEIVSDNGSNFRKANVIFKELLDKLKDSYLRTKFPTIRWRFGPAYAPYYTGIVERMVQKAKKAIDAILAGARFSEQQLLTATTIAANFINNYPLTYELSDAGEPLALTPNDFLHGRQLCDISPGIPADWKYGQRFKYLEQVMDMYWERFFDEVVPELHKFHKTPADGDNLAEGDIVILLDKERRGDWTLGRVLPSEPGVDGVLRKVKVFSNGRIKERHPRGLCKLVGGEAPERPETDNDEELQSMAVFYFC